MFRRIIPGLALVGLVAQTAVAALPRDQFSLFGNATVQGDRRFLNTVSLVSDTEADPAYAGIAFTPMPFDGEPLTMADVHTLKVAYKILQGGFGGGSMRFEIALDSDGDTEADGNVFIYLGAAPNFTEDPNGWIGTGNLIESTDLRFDTSQIGGTFYDSYANAVELAGDSTVVSINLVVDSGWFFEGGLQEVLVGALQINYAVLRANTLSNPQ